MRDRGADPSRRRDCIGGAGVDGAVPADPRAALAAMPPLLRSYLGMGGWVSDHAVIDPSTEDACAVISLVWKVKTADMSGICMRGKPGWGDLFAPLTTVVQTFGGNW